MSWKWSTVFFSTISWAFRIRIRIRIVTGCQNDNHSPGPWPGRLVPSSKQRSELSNTLLGTFSKEDKKVWKWLQSLIVWGKKLHLLISVLAMGIWYAIECSFLRLLTRGIRSSVGILALPFRPLYNKMSLLSLLRFLRDSYFIWSRMSVMLPVSKL